jgi:hypothetical protein
VWEIGGVTFEELSPEQPLLDAWLVIAIYLLSQFAATGEL